MLGGMPGGPIVVRPAEMIALAARLRQLGEDLATVERVAGDGAAASGDPAVGLALSTFDDSWDANRQVLADDLTAGADSLVATAEAFAQQDELLAELLAHGSTGDDRDADGGG